MLLKSEIQRSHEKLIEQRWLELIDRDFVQINGLVQGSFINATLRWGTATMQIASDNINALNMTTVPAGSRNSFTVSPTCKNLLTNLYGRWGFDGGITRNAICIILAPTSWVQDWICAYCALRYQYRAELRSVSSTHHSMKLFNCF